jgi:hypothetical protein
MLQRLFAEGSESLALEGKFVMPAQTGIQVCSFASQKALDSGLHRNDGKPRDRHTWFNEVHR